MQARWLVVALVALSTLVAPLAGAQAPEKVVFALNWFAVGDHAAYWVALDRGYYKAKGLDVELQNSKGSGDSIAKVTWVNIEPAAKVPALAEKRVDAVADYTTGLPFYEKAMGKGNAVMLPWADHGFDMYSMSIVASDKTMKERPRVLRAFLEASYQGWRDVMENPKSALEIFKKRVPEIDLSIIEPNMLMGLELMKTDRYARQGIGWIEEKKMCQSVDLVNTYMGVPTKVDCKAVFTTEFLPKIELPKTMR
jgi:NitT/TauT family transport system substrate-binding protein